MRIISTRQPVSTGGIPQEAIPEIGRIGLGKLAQTEGGKVYPTATDYFVPRGRAQDLFTQLYGPQPRQLPICFYNDAEEASCNVRLEIRDRKGDLYAYSDGQTFYFRPKDGSPGYTKLVTLQQVPDIALRTEAHLQKGLAPDKAKHIVWKPTLSLRFMIRDFPLVGYWQIMTHGAQSTIPQVTNMVDTWKQLLGSLCMVPFVLRIKRGKSSDKAKQFTYLNLLPDFSLDHARQFAQNRPKEQVTLPHASLLNPPPIGQPDHVYEPTVVSLPAGNV